MVREFSPLHVSTFLWSVEVLAKLLEFSGGKNNFSHIKTDSELSLSDKPASELVEVSEELGNSDSLLETAGSNSSNDVLNVLWLVLQNVSFNWLWLSFWVVVVTVVEVSSHSEHLLWGVNVVAEVDIVNLVNITLVHVSLQKAVHEFVWNADSQLSQHSHELHFGNVTVSCDVEILELRLQVESLVVDCNSILV